MERNCQCDAEFHGDWYTNNTGRNVPAWFCVRCGAFADTMEREDAIAFRQGWFSSAPGRRATWAKRFTVDGTGRCHHHRGLGTQMTMFRK